MDIEQHLPLQPVFVSKRYQLVRALGKGGMGVVYEARDRWNNETVALKHVTSVTPLFPFGSRPSPSKDVELALANEFRTLTSLHHPHIIHVLDYGFDTNRLPYFTMELLTDATSILKAAHSLPTNDKIRLLLQTLQALAYLHHRGILHHDLKPDNIAVIDRHTVKMLDFGLATRRGSEHVSGTLTYMAPEILRDQPAAEATDLYAFGLIAYQLFADRYPFVYETPEGFLHAALHEQPADIAGLSLSLNGVIQRLLSKDPDQRYGSAVETMAALARAAGLPLPAETTDIRESFLQTAPLVGRAREMVQLEDSLLDALGGRGGGWLIGGESGIGKSRLVYEIRNRALIEGAVVIVGQAVRETGHPYAVWREPLRWLALYSPPTNDEASILKTLIPDIEALLGRTLADPPALTAYQYEEALAALIFRLMHGLETMAVLVFEDIQWMTNEGLTLLTRVSETLNTQRCLLLGTYRQEERADLPSLLMALDWMPLHRFSQEMIQELSQEILGHAGRDERLIAFLDEQTEGNAFFIVEIIRELAERAGTLGHIMNKSLPNYIMTGGISEIMQRRLSMVRPIDRSFLSMAAIAGRHLDLEVLGALNPSINLEQWVERCQRQAILEFDGKEWRFAHDKIRESLLSLIPDKDKRSTHRQVAEAIEDVYGRSSGKIGQMAYHWHAAGNDEKTAYYMAQVAAEAIRIYAYKQARMALHTALEALGRLPATFEHNKLRIDLTLKLVNVSFTAVPPSENLALLQGLNQLIEANPEYEDRQQVIDIYYALGRVSYTYTQPEQALTFLRRMSIAAQEMKDVAQDAFAVTMMGRVVSLQGFFQEALALLDASETLAQPNRWSDWTINQAYIGFCRVYVGDENGFQVGLEAVEHARSINHASVLAISMVFMAMSSWQAERYEDALRYATEAIAIARSSGDLTPLHIAYGFRAWTHSRKDQHDEAWADFREYERIVNSMGGRLVCFDWFAAARAELLYNTGYIGDAIAQAQAAVDIAEDVGGVFACGIAHRVWAQALAARDDTPWEEIEQHLKSSLDNLITSDAHFEMEHTRRVWDSMVS